MALTLSRVGPPTVDGNRKRVDYDVTFDSNYADDGESLTPANVGLRVIDSAVPHGPFMDSGKDNGVLVKWHSNTLVAIWGNAGTASVLPEVTSTTDISGYSGRITFRGW